MLIAPVIFCTVVIGITNVGDIKKLGRIGAKALLYFEVVTTIALLIGLAAVKIMQPGAGMNIDPATIDTKAVQQYTTSGKTMHTVEFLLNVIPDTIVGAFSNGETLQVLFVAILVGAALAQVDRDRKLLEWIERISKVLFRAIAVVMRAAPLGAFGAIAFTIGRFGLKTLIPLGKVLLCMFTACATFLIVVLGTIALFHRFSLWKLVRYLREELLIVFATSSSEPVLPYMLSKMERLGCGKPVVGLVIPSGYSFNLDGSSIYLTIAVIFVAQATNTSLSFSQTFTLLVVLMLTSKGAAAVTGGAFITLAATLASLGTVPVAGIALLLGIDRFMSQMRSLTNLIGNGVATIVVADWERAFDRERAEQVLNGHVTDELQPQHSHSAEPNTRWHPEAQGAQSQPLRTEAEG
jgi:aerobic C4-dicarboxylate transport protein